MENKERETELFSKEEKNLPGIMGAILIAAMVVLALVLEREKATASVMNELEVPDKNVIVIDAGHGGGDSGKVGINGLLEKDINLQIALRVQSLLEAQGITVYMTRSDDIGFYSEEEDNKKMADMKKRVTFINEKNPYLCVSIHQNSYGEEYVSGAQVFYHERSENAKLAAEIMQEQLRQSLDKDNDRQVKNNTSYYLLKHTDCPTIIAECGFLSNWEEAEKLGDSQYQEQVAWAIHLGILRYINSQ